MGLLRRRVCRPRSPFRSLVDAWLRPIQRQGGLVLLVLSIAGTSVLLYTLPVVWVQRQLEVLTSAFQDGHWQQFQKVYHHWTRFDPPPAFHQGDEAKVQAYLAAHPLVVAVEDGQGRLWIREGDQLRSGEGTAAAAYRGWTEEARRAGGMLYPVPPASNPGHLQAPVLVLQGRPWTLVKRWPVGGAEVETALRNFQKEDPRPLRVGLRRSLAKERPAGPTPSWAQPPNLQAVFPRGFRSPWELMGTDASFGEGWEMAALPSREDLAELEDTIQREQRWAWSVYALILAGLSLGLYLRHRMRQRERLDADRLAGLAHSLKTPLAVLKLRCDSLRLGSLPAQVAEGQLLRIGEEVESLVCLIENSLQTLRRHHTPSLTSEVPPAFYEQVRKDLGEAFTLEGRELELSHDGHTHRAHLPSLRAALVTLLENALAHGSGKVGLRIGRQGRLSLIEVSDAGPGLSDESQLHRIGEPFMRFRREGEQGFLREGQGLGLSLLLQSARREGWGVEFMTDPETGFSARLEIAG